MVDDFEESKNGFFGKEKSKIVLNSPFKKYRFVQIGNMDDFILKMEDLQDELGIPKNKHVDVFVNRIKPKIFILNQNIKIWPKS